MTDRWTDRRTEGGDCNIPDAFLKKRGDKYVCLPYLKFSDQLSETHLFFLFGLNTKISFYYKMGQANLLHSKVTSNDIYKILYPH